MTIEVKRNFDLAKEMRENLKDVGKTLERELALIATDMKIDISHGKDFEGGNFKGYSDGYKREREVHGRSGAPVDLHITGTLTNGITSKITKASGSSIEGQVFIINATGPGAPWRKKARAISNVDKAKYLQFESKKPRKFFGISEKRIEVLFKRIIEAFK